MKVVNRKDIAPFITLDNSIIREILAYRNSELKNLSLAEAIVPPGRETFLHFHKKAQEVYFILRGVGKIQIGGESRIVRKNDTILIFPKKRHKIKNTGKRNLVFLCICSPCYEYGDTVISR